LLYLNSNSRSSSAGTALAPLPNATNASSLISTAGLEEVTSLTQTLSFNAMDILRVMIQVEDADIKLDIRI